METSGNKMVAKKYPAIIPKKDPKNDKKISSKMKTDIRKFFEIPIALRVLNIFFLCMNDKFIVELTINKPTRNDKNPKAVRFK